MFVISNRPRASRSSDFEITRAITPWIVLHSVQLLLLIISFLQTLALLASFQTKLDESEEKEEEDIDDNETENDDDDTGW